MNRVRAMAITATLLVVAGCGFATYESRMDSTLKELREEQKLKTYTEEPAQGKFKELNVYIRPPKPLAEDSLQLAQAPGMFDHGATFSGAPQGVPAKEGETAPILPPLKLHVLVRSKAKKATPKKGEAPPPADPNAAAAAGRGNFITDVRDRPRRRLRRRGRLGEAPAGRQGAEQFLQAPDLHRGQRRHDPGLFRRGQQGGAGDGPGLRHPPRPAQEPHRDQRRGPHPEVLRPRPEGAQHVQRQCPGWGGRWRRGCGGAGLLTTPGEVARSRSPSLPRGEGPVQASTASHCRRAARSSASRSSSSRTIGVAPGASMPSRTV